MYSKTLNQSAKAELSVVVTDYNMVAHNDIKKASALNRYSENDLNSWSYSLLKEGKMKEALEVFKLNTVIHPNSWNTFDSYGEALLKNGELQEAIKMYQKSIELNPANENGKKILQTLKQSIRGMPGKDQPWQFYQLPLTARLLTHH